MEDRSPESAASESPSLAAGDRSAAVVEKMLAAADVTRAFGEPIRHGDTILIPAAEVLAAAGFGMGSGSGMGRDREGVPTRGGGGGGGGGGRTMARAVAVVVATPDGVEVRPVLDFTKIALAALTAAGFVIASWRRLQRARGGSER
jgi:uncharacterized spore protein YtfJ